ncbi:putative ubiquitin regulatory protein (ISS) [Trypanosoma theileri]|uniref:Putative ubiquitin regulatory protein (ISS) n=1 Tax=Trypanosoma theileri TaxID=67003 RepID=A0A1X0P8K7_9TRYP|nr:putative ubiquitin regulatory protein (ISS) [Trypanosoma theileri]ORC93208.1 putative ubiquitin regulatory protein (ISS) [Trypanosoma theileri]
MSGHENENESGVRGTRDLSSNSSTAEDDNKTYFISQALFETLQGKGFSDNAIKKSIVAGCIDEGSCTQWITMHEGHPELDTPLDDGVQVVVKVKRVLTEAEREAKVRELREKAKAKSEEAKRLAAEEERRRIEMGRKALETKEKLDALRREAELAAVRKEKEADAIARRRVKLQILADKYVRGGMSREEAQRTAEAELEAAAQKRREESAAQMDKQTREAETTRGEVRSATESWNLQSITASVGTSLGDVFDKPADPPAALPHLVEEMLKYQNHSMVRQCITVLRTILTNIHNHPFDITKRTLKTSTNTFSTKLLPVLPALQLLHTCGFELVTDANGSESLMATTVVIRVIEEALQLLPKDVEV